MIEQTATRQTVSTVRPAATEPARSGSADEFASTALQDLNAETTPGCRSRAVESQSSAPRELRHHRLMLAISAAVVVLAFLLEVQPEGRVACRGLPEHPLPHACLSRLWFGVACPGCGLTRSFIHLARGDIAAAWALNPCGWILALATLAQFPYRTVVLARRGRRPWPREWSVWFGYGLVALLLVTWLARTIQRLAF